MSNNKLATYDAHTDLVMARLRSPKVKDTDEPVAEKHLVTLIDAACMAKGVNMQKEAMDLTAAMLLRQMREDRITADLTWEEVSKAIQEGTFGKYGEVYGINAVSLYDMVWGYVESQERAALIQKERDLRYGEDRKRQEKLEAFLTSHPAYAEIIRKNYIENQKQKTL